MPGSAAPKQETLDELFAISPAMASVRDEVERDAAKTGWKVETRGWVGGFRPNRSGGSKRKTKPSRVQTHLALALQESGDTDHDND